MNPEFLILVLSSVALFSGGAIFGVFLTALLLMTRDPQEWGE